MKLYESYRTNPLAPKCVKYWDKVFRNTELFFNWQATLVTVEHQVSIVQQELQVSAREARVLVWDAYCDAVTGDVTSPFFQEYDDLCQAVTESLMPIFTIAMSIGVDINAGFSEREATREFQNWLAEDPDNGTFGRYRINEDLTIEQVR